jgi:hypothetical protein
VEWSIGATTSQKRLKITRTISLQLFKGSITLEFLIFSLGVVFPFACGFNVIFSFKNLKNDVKKADRL